MRAPVLVRCFLMSIVCTVPSLQITSPVRLSHEGSCELIIANAINPEPCMAVQPRPRRSPAMTRVARNRTPPRYYIIEQYVASNLLYLWTGKAAYCTERKFAATYTATERRHASRQNHTTLPPGSSSIPHSNIWHRTMIRSRHVRAVPLQTTAQAYPASREYACSGRPE